MTPHGFYGHFGMTETLNEDRSKTCDAANDDEEEEDAGETSSSLEAIVITKPKEGFLDNELFSDDNMDISDDTLKNNINSIASLKEEDIEVYEIMTDSSNGNKTGTKEDEDHSGNRYVKSSSGNRYVKSSEESDVNSEDPDAYRIDNTPGFLDNTWRIKNNAYPVDNRGFGRHKETLQEMENTGSEKDQELLQVLSDVTGTVSKQACEEDDEEGDNDEEGDSVEDGDSREEGDSDNKCETCGYISDEGSDGDGTPTSEYGSAKEEIMNRSHNSDTGDNSIVQKEGDGATVPERKECDITDNDGGGKSEVDEAPADQKERDVTEHEKRGVDEQKCDVNATLPADRDVTEERDVTQQPILITPQPHPTGIEQVTASDLQLNSIVDLSGQMLIDAQTGQAHNIDDVNISQFNEVFIVNPVDNPLQEFQTVKIQLIEETVTIKEEQENIDQKVVEQIQVNVNTQVGDVQTKDHVTGENEDSTNPEDASPDKKRDVTVTEEKNDTTNPDDARTDTKCDNNSNTKETGETSDVTNEKEGENDNENDDNPEKNCDVTEDNQVKEKVNEGTEEQKDKDHAKEENDTSESDIEVLAQYKEKKKNIEVIDLMTSSSDENKCDIIDKDTKEQQKSDVIDEDAKEQKRDVIDEDAKEQQKRDVIDEGVKRALKWQKVPMKIAVKRFYKGGKAYSSEGDVPEKEIEKKDGSLSDGDRHKTDVSPDKCVVTFSKNAVKIKDTVTPRRDEVRSQYRCGLA